MARATPVAHGYLVDGPVFRCEGLMLSLLGAADPSTLRSWFSGLSERGQVVSELERRPWGASDGQVIDRFGLQWLIGFEESEND